MKGHILKQNREDKPAILVDKAEVFGLLVAAVKSLVHGVQVDTNNLIVDCV